MGGPAHGAPASAGRCRGRSGSYRAAFDTALPHAKQVADPFHVVRLGNDALDEVRRRVQNQTMGHRGHKHDPLYRARKLLVSASENITEHGRAKLRGLLDAGDPYGEVRDAWHAKESLCSVYDIDDAEVGAATIDQLAADLQGPRHARRDQPWGPRHLALGSRRRS